jgi:hypothetical protein
MPLWRERARLGRLQQDVEFRYLAGPRLELGCQQGDRLPLRRDQALQGIHGAAKVRHGLGDAGAGLGLPRRVRTLLRGCCSTVRRLSAVRTLAAARRGERADSFE